MAKISDDTLQELDDILNGEETYGDRLTAFLKLKTAPKPQNTNNQFVLGNFDVSFDLDVDLVKLPPKVQPKDANNSKATERRPLCEGTNNTRAANESPSVAAIHLPTLDIPAPRSRSPLISPRRSLRRSGGVPGSDRLRRVAIQRRSKSCDRRDLLKEFNDVGSRQSNSQEESNSISRTNTLNFIPGISSTPGTEPQAKQQAAATAVDQEQVDVSYKHSQRPENVPLSTSQRAMSTNNATVQRTYTIEMGPEPGQLLLSPSRKSNSSLLNLSPAKSVYNASNNRQSPARASPARLEILAPDTPPRIMSQQLQRETEFTVPETQPQEEAVQQQVFQTLTSSPKAVPFVVLPISCLSPKTSKPIEDKTKAATAPASPKVASRSMQTSGNSRYVQNVDEILTDDDSDDQRESSSVPLNLAPPGGNTTRQSRLRKCRQSVKSPNMLLDLHSTRLNNSQRRPTTRQTVLNKPSKPPINGEKFAQELARMSNYEILDLRKRNSRGKLHPMNGRRQQLKEQQNLEECIEWELMRRNLDDLSPKKSVPKLPLPKASPSAKSPSFRLSPAASPAGFRAKSSREQRRLRRKNESSSDSPDSSIENRHKEISKKRRERPRLRKPSLSENELLAVCTPPAQFRRSRYRKDEEPSTTLLAEPPAEFRRNSSVQLRKSKRCSQQQATNVVTNDADPADPPMQLRKSKSRYLMETNKTVLAEPPPDFRSSYRQSNSKHLDQLDEVETDENALPTPPAQFRKSKSIHQEQHKVVSNGSALHESPTKSRLCRSRLRIKDDTSDDDTSPVSSAQLRKSKSRHLHQLHEVETGENALPTPPAQFRKSKSRHQEQHEAVSNDDDTSPVPSAQLRKSKSRLLHQFDDVDSNETELPDPPLQFRKSRSKRIELNEAVSKGSTIQETRRNRSRLRIVDDESDEAEPLEPTAQVQKSKSRHMEIVESDQTIQRDNCEQIRKSKSRHLELLEVAESKGHSERTTVTMDVQEILEAFEKIGTHLSEAPAMLKPHSSRQHIEDDDSDGAALPNIIETNATVADTPAQSESGQKNITVAESNEIQLADSPPQLQRSISRGQELLVAPKSCAAAVEMPSLQYVEEVRSNDADNGGQTIINSLRQSCNNNASQLSSRDQQPPPTLPIETDIDLDELPSTSRASRKDINSRRDRMEKATNKDKEAEKQPPSAEDDVFKKPLAPAPRSKKNSKLKNSSKEVEKLRIMRPNQTLVATDNDSVDDPNTTGVRKSKRGHVPLRNTWVHTQSDPFFFMRTAPHPKNQSHINNTDVLMNRPPLSSSTPRNEVSSNDTTARKRKRNKQTEQISGITSLSSIAEHSVEPSMKPVANQLLEQPTKKKQGRKKKIKIIDPAPPVGDVAPEELANGGGVSNEVITAETPSEPESAPACPPTPQSISASQSIAFDLDWLRNLSDQPILKDKNVDEENNSVVISRAANVQCSPICGMDYAFYSGSENSVGYIRFQPLQSRGYNKPLRKLQQFVVLHGRVEVELSREEESRDDKTLPAKFILNPGDFLRIKMGTRFNITNVLNEISVVFTIRSEISGAYTSK